MKKTLFVKRGKVIRLGIRPSCKMVFRHDCIIITRGRMMFIPRYLNTEGSAFPENIRLLTELNFKVFTMMSINIFTIDCTFAYAFALPLRGSHKILYKFHFIWIFIEVPNRVTYAYFLHLSVLLPIGGITHANWRPWQATVVTMDE